MDFTYFSNFLDKKDQSSNIFFQPLRSKPNFKPDFNKIEETLNKVEV